MSDLISRQAAIDAIENTDCELSADAWDELTDALMQLPSAQRWIPVSERLPKPNETENDCLVYYLVQNEYGDMMVAAYLGYANGEKWWEQMYAHKPTQDEIIAWMPLPKPYKEEKNMKIKFHRAYFANLTSIDVIGENRFKRTVKKLCRLEHTHVIRFEKVYKDIEEFREDWPYD